MDYRLRTFMAGEDLNKNVFCIFFCVVQLGLCTAVKVGGGLRIRRKGVSVCPTPARFQNFSCSDLSPLPLGLDVMIYPRRSLDFRPKL